MSSCTLWKKWVAGDDELEPLHSVHDSPNMCTLSTAFLPRIGEGGLELQKQSCRICLTGALKAVYQPRLHAVAHIPSGGTAGSGPVGSAS